MAFSKFTTDVNYHQALGNRPNSNDGLTADELKERYDQGVNDIKYWLNNTLTPELDSNSGLNLGIVNVMSYHASGSEQATTGSITSGSRDLTVASAIDFAVGQGISIAGAGAAGATLVTTIASINGLVFTLADSASTTVSVVAVSHDDGAAIRAAFATGNKNVRFPPGSYRIKLTEGDNLVSLTGVNDIKISGQAAKIVDTKTDYDFDGAITSVFKFDGCNNIEIELDFEGQTLSDPDTDLGYKGLTFARFINGCENLRIKGTLENCRYGVHSGSYSDETEGNCRGFEIDLHTDFVGYPIALYLAEDVNAKIRATNTHRAAYLAGVSGGTIDAEFRDQYLAPIQVIITDAKTGTGTSRGCSNLKIKAHDTGSTITPTTGSFCAGISLSRVDPGTIFENIEFDIYVSSTDSVSPLVGGFIIVSNVVSIIPSYPYNWENTIYLRNIKLKGSIEKGAQTIANGDNGDIFISTSAAEGHSATISNFIVEDLIVNSCSSPQEELYFSIPNLIDVASFNNLIVTGNSMTLSSNLVSKINIRNAKIEDMTVFGKYSFIDSSVSNITDTGDNGNFLNTFVTGAKAAIRLSKKEITLNGSSPITWSNAIQAGALILDVQTLVTEAITGASNISVGTATTFNLYSWGSPVTLGSRTTATAGTAAALTPTRYATATDLRVTGNASFTGGKVLIMIWYVELIAPSL